MEEFKKQIAIIAQNYCGALPKDRGCTNWAELQQKMVAEITAAVNSSAPAGNPKKDIYHTEVTNSNCFILLSAQEVAVPTGTDSEMKEHTIMIMPWNLEGDKLKQILAFVLNNIDNAEFQMEIQRMVEDTRMSPEPPPSNN